MVLCNRVLCRLASGFGVGGGVRYYRHQAVTLAVLASRNATLEVVTHLRAECGLLGSKAPRHICIRETSHAVEYGAHCTQTRDATSVFSF